MTVNCKLYFDILKFLQFAGCARGGSDLGVQGGQPPLPPPKRTNTTKDDLRIFNTTGILQEKKVHVLFVLK